VLASLKKEKPEAYHMLRQMSNADPLERGGFRILLREPWINQVDEFATIENQGNTMLIAENKLLKSENCKFVEDNMKKLEVDTKKWTDTARDVLEYIKPERCNMLSNEDFLESFYKGEQKFESKLGAAFVIAHAIELVAADIVCRDFNSGSIADFLGMFRDKIDKHARQYLQNLLGKVNNGVPKGLVKDYKEKVGWSESKMDIHEKSRREGWKEAALLLLNDIQQKVILPTRPQQGFLELDEMKDAVENAFVDADLGEKAKWKKVADALAILLWANYMVATYG
jgi:hypothetical protein